MMQVQMVLKRGMISRRGRPDLDLYGVLEDVLQLAQDYGCHWLPLSAGPILGTQSYSELRS